MTGQWPSLTTVPAGTRAVVRDLRMTRADARRLLGLGLRVGSQVEVLHQRRSGVVVSLEGTRIALGRAVAESVLIEAIAQPAVADLDAELGDGLGTGLRTGLGAGVGG